MRWRGVLAAALAWVAANTIAQADSIRWVDLEIHYAPAEWELSPNSAQDRILFVCVAPACRDGPMVLAAASRADAAAAADRPFADESRPLSLPPEAALPFFVDSRWSGCRALDHPIHEGTLEHDGIVYRLTTAVTDGCQRGPELPEDLFLGLVAGIVPAPAR